MDQKNFIGEKEIKNYKEFAFKDDMFKLAIGFILGNSFNSVVGGISDYLVMPVIKFIISETGEEWRKWKFIPFKGLEFELGRLAGVVVDFLLVSIVLYIIYVKIIGGIINRNKPEFVKDCSFCYSKIDYRSKKCKFCTSKVKSTTQPLKGLGL
jgi:large conductance mechanosensitive channel